MSADDEKVSLAQINLEYALGRRTISLRDLAPDELSQLIHRFFDELDLRELRGFRPLREVICRNADSSFGYPEVRLPKEDEPALITRCEWVVMSPKRDVDVHVVDVTGGGNLGGKLVYRRHESGDETDDKEIIHLWGKSAYLYRSEEVRLILRRPLSRDSRSDLFVMNVSSVKVPHVNQMRIVSVETERLEYWEFLKTFGQDGPRIVFRMMDAVRTLVIHTLADLELKARQFGYKADMTRRIIESISP